MRFLEHRIPPPIVAFLAGAAMWFIARPVPILEHDEVPRAAAIALFASLGLLFPLAGILSFRRAKTTVNPLKPEAASALVTSGIYRVTRNPMYVGLTLMLVAWALYLKSWPALGGAVFFLAYIDRFQVVPEERALAALFGAGFEAYRARVRRWL